MLHPKLPLDYTVFASSDFDPNDYANAILAGESYPPQTGALRPVRTSGIEPAKEDISVAISKLDVGIEDVSRQIKNVVRIVLYIIHSRITKQN